MAYGRRWFPSVDRGPWDVEAYAATEYGRETIYSSRRDTEAAS